MGVLRAMERKFPSLIFYLPFLPFYSSPLLSLTRSYFPRYIPATSSGDIHDAYYAHRRRIWPPTHERTEGESYGEGALLYGFGSPMLTVQGKDQAVEA